jgi:hypothetical protein
MNQEAQAMSNYFVVKFTNGIEAVYEVTPGGVGIAVVQAKSKLPVLVPLLQQAINFILTQ